jgi:putative sugar O-methyltransferase
MNQLKALLEEYRKAPEIFQAGRYWKAYEDNIIREIEMADINQLRSGAYPIFGTFGFSESVYHYPPQMPFYLKFFKKIVRFLFITNKATLPYSLRLQDIREMAYHNCLIQGESANIKSISEIETSSFGNPADLFEIKGKKYTMQFLNFYIRLCFAQKQLRLTGTETVVELGSGSGFQVEVLKKVFPDLTIICFDLPYSLFLCEQYLMQSLEENALVKSSETINWTDLKSIEQGKVHLIGNWKFPLLHNTEFDVFWNAASFGEMEPEIVRNYLSYILGSCNYIYLLQARKGKESTNTSGVKNPISFDDYNSMLNDYQLISESDAFEAHRRMTQSGGYFQAVWQKVNSN